MYTLSYRCYTSYIMYIYSRPVKRKNVAHSPSRIFAFMAATMTLDTPFMAMLRNILENLGVLKSTVDFSAV